MNVSLRTHLTSSHRSRFTEVDKLRWRRTVRLFLIYWAGVVFVGAFLPRGVDLENIRPLARLIVGNMDVVMRVASHSFDSAYLEVFVAYCLSSSVLLSLISMFWLPRGSHVVFQTWSAKLSLVSIGALLFLAAWFSVDFGPSKVSLTEGRSSALVYLGTTSRAGAIFALGSLWGFAQLFFLQTFRTVLIAQVKP